MKVQRNLNTLLTWPQVRTKSKPLFFTDETANFPEIPADQNKKHHPR